MSERQRPRGVVDLVRQHPQFLWIAARVARRNLTHLIDYNFMDGRSLAPKAVTFRISGQCNLFCQMCGLRQTGVFDATQMLPFELFKKVIDEVYRHKLFVAFTGGEPLLHPQIVECVRYAKEKGLHCSLVTNGLLLRRYAADLVDSGLDLLSVSIDGPEEMHDRIRGRSGLYRRIMDGLEEVKRFERRPMLFFSTTIQADNYLLLEQVAKNAMRAGVDGLSLQHLQTQTPDRTARHNARFPQYQVRDGWIDESLSQIDTTALAGVLERVKSVDMPISVFPALSPQDMAVWYSDPLQLLNGQRIRCPWLMASVCWDGTMRMCNDLIMGDLREEGFWDIWNGEKMRQFRHAAKESKVFPICATCCSLYRDRMM